MHLKMGHIAAAEQALGRLLQKDLPIKAAVSLDRLSRMVGDELQVWHRTRLRLIDMFGTTDAAGQKRVHPGMPGFDVFVAKIREMSDVDVELPWAALPVSALGNITISPADLRVLLGIFLIESDSINPK